MKCHIATFDSSHFVAFRPKLPKSEKAGGLQAVFDAVAALGVEGARSALAFAIGAALHVSGKVLKRVKRDGQCKLVIEPGDIPGFVVFADFEAGRGEVEARKIRKGSAVQLRGDLRSFGWAAVCLSDCRLNPGTGKKTGEKQGK